MSGQNMEHAHGLNIQYIVCKLCTHERSKYETRSGQKLTVLDQGILADKFRL